MTKVIQKIIDKRNFQDYIIKNGLIEFLIENCITNDLFCNDILLSDDFQLNFGDIEFHPYDIYLGWIYFITYILLRYEDSRKCLQKIKEISFNRLKERIDSLKGYLYDHDPTLIFLMLSEIYLYFYNGNNGNLLKFNVHISAKLIYYLEEKFLNDSLIMDNFSISRIFRYFMSSSIVNENIEFLYKRTEEFLTLYKYADELFQYEIIDLFSRLMFNNVWLKLISETNNFNIMNSLKMNAKNEDIKSHVRNFNCDLYGNISILRKRLVLLSNENHQLEEKNSGKYFFF